MTAKRFRFPLPTLLLCGLTALSGGCSQLVERSNCGIRKLDETCGVAGSICRGAKYAGWVLSAPLAVAMSPIAALAWATPWVDLPMAVDFASAPSIGVGYVLQALVGYPTRLIVPPPEYMSFEGKQGQFMRWNKDRWTPWGFIAEHNGVARNPRPPEPLPPEVNAHYPVDRALLDRLREGLSAARERSRCTVALPLGDDFPCRFEFYRAAANDSKPRRPLIFLTPPLQGTFAARYMARRFARRGIHAAVIAPERDILEAHPEPKQLEVRFRALVVAARTAVAALTELEEVDRDQLHYLGISAGGIFGAVLLAVEPSINRAVLLFPGGDLARIVRESDESTVKGYRDAWAARGVDPEALARLINDSVRTDPQRLARSIDPRRVLLFLGESDTRVPLETGFSLWEAMGEPETYLLGGNHETASICFGFLLRRSEEFLLAGEKHMPANRAGPLGLHLPTGQDEQR